MVEVTSKLLKTGASVLSVDSDGLTPALSCAPNLQVAQCLSLILKSYLQLNNKDCNGKYVLFFCIVFYCEDHIIFCINYYNKLYGKYTITFLLKTLIYLIQSLIYHTLHHYKVYTVYNKRDCVTGLHVHYPN